MKKELLLVDVLEAIKEDSYIELMDAIEVEENLYLDCIVEGQDVIINYADYNNNLRGGFILYYEDIKNLTQKDFESLLDEIYYYNCNIPIED